MNEKELIRAAFLARKNAYAPYSGYKVGAALITGDGSVITGCNVENSSYGLCNCAERTAVFKAVSEGYKSFRAIAIVGGANDEDETADYAYPCGACRQVLREFTDPETFRVIVARSEADYKEFKLSELLPHSFGPDSIV
ncbi:MAG: cytidine deaminase [Lachnospiraceae bacterium]|nr:cytidine deaminase [Lachnospiraceae bacterium]